ncbi:uncharacterized protein ACA1_304160 [Acanthamoeba castellanii str. Neff]|uniref:Uncharacterized protein n=1 Tax=Acanthamoeba castellanii (strain ATCC 30010 / Neff) TaxID=1257118 RepID=L8GUX2_ACACF|nr:uncharacterized protein ACA1_304160 [Acanthamoeba castellanii str. Neff]ELR16984.1 hypothetical protein ACA1_304160 [Acanthamoeba castellanii str. Neff]
MFWSSSTGVVTRATTPISRTMSGEDSEITSGATTTSVAATSAAVAAAATALIRAHATQQLRKRRRSQSAPPPRDQAIIVARNGRQVRRQCDDVDDNSDYESRAPAMALTTTSSAGTSSPYSSPMAVSSPQSCVEHCYGQSATTSSPPTSPTGASRTSTTKRSDIYGLLN